MEIQDDQTGLSVLEHAKHGLSMRGNDHPCGRCAAVLRSVVPEFTVVSDEHNHGAGLSRM